jgi:hypothetical protein
MARRRASGQKGSDSDASFTGEQLAAGTLQNQKLSPQRTQSSQIKPKTRPYGCGHFTPEGATHNVRLTKERSSPQRTQSPQRKPRQEHSGFYRPLDKEKRSPQRRRARREHGGHTLRLRPPWRASSLRQGSGSSTGSTLRVERRGESKRRLIAQMIWEMKKARRDERTGLRVSQT